jgi:L-ascorbate metabolism protein UlaG (beta-lactamase superfamily)
VSHDHDDHNGLDGLPPGYEAVTAPGEHSVAGIDITSIKTFHDSHQGKERGRNIVHVIAMDGLRIAHLGDLGHVLADDETRAIGKVDVVLIPVGGHFTIEPKDAVAVVRQLRPSVVIPMHFKTPSLSFPIKQVEDFLSLAGKHERPGKSEIEIKQENLSGQRIIVLEHAL